MGASSGRVAGRLQGNLALGALSVLLGCAVAPACALANNIGENVAWQFQTTGDKLNRAAIEDMRQKKQSGYYAAPVYTTNIERQYNCSVSSVAAGSQGSSTAIGNSPTSTGHSASSLGNTDSSNLQPGNNSSGGTLTGTQNNTGEVESFASGEVETIVDGNSYQTLNTDQNNSGNQTASVNLGQNSSACEFAQ